MSKEQQRQMVWETVSVLSEWHAVTHTELLDLLSNTIERVQKIGVDGKIKFEIDKGEDPYSDSYYPALVMRYERLETPAECAVRTKKEEEYAATRERWERAQWEQLKAKYGGK